MTPVPQRAEVRRAHLADHERAGMGGVDAVGELREHVPVGVVLDRVDGIDAQAVDAVVAHPELGVLDRPLAHSGLRVVERLPPRRHAEAVCEVRPERAQRLVPRAEVVVDDVEHDGEALTMGGVDEARQPLRTAVGGVRREGVEPVVAPAAVAREGRHRHQLDCGDAELAQPAQARDHAVERARGRERADVELVEDELVEREVRARSDLERRRVEDSRRAENAVRLPARAGIGPGGLPVEDEAVVVAGRSGQPALPDTIGRFSQEVIAVGQAHGHPAGLGSPGAQLDRPGLERNGAER